ncbi:hypothetical protein MTO96_031563 [Rhipicephalus appendiculatus]
MVNNINYGSCKNFMKAADLPNNIVRPFGAPQSPIADSEVNICAQKQAVGGVAPAPACVTSEGGSINTAQQFHAQESTGSPRSQSLRNVRVVADCFSSPAVNRPRRKSTGTSLTSDVGRPTLNENQKTAPANRTQMLLLFGDPTFYILAFQNTVMSYSSFMFRSLIVDYARDKGVPLANAELMGTYCAASDLLLGHVGLPFLADRGFVNRTLLAALTFGLLSASMFALSVSERFVSFLGIFLVQSLLISATASFSPVLVTDYLGACRVPITCGVSGLVTGPLLLATPSITGFFRDTRGSYDNLVRLIAGMAATSAILILLLRILRKKWVSSSRREASTRRSRIPPGSCIPWDTTASPSFWKPASSRSSSLFPDRGIPRVLSGMDSANKMDNESPTTAPGADTTTTAAGSTKHRKKHKSRDGKRRHPSATDVDGKSPESAVSSSENVVKTGKRSKKSRETHDDDGARETKKTPEMVSTPDAPRPPKQEDADHGTLPSTATAPMPSSMIPSSMIPSQPTSAASRPSPARHQPMAQKDGAAVPATEERTPADVFLVSAVACVVIIAGLALALVGIILGTMIPAGEHSCPPLDKPLEEGNVMVETKFGRLVGTLVSVHGATLAGFLGVPFAQSTAGERRFMAPLPLPASRDACAVQEYLQQRPPCAQLLNGTFVGTEDCLHVNVWTPATALELHGVGMGRPVVVAVSGSLFETGSNDDSDWPRLAAKGDVVVMAPNYRQGVLGFLHPSNVPGVDVDVAVNDVWSAVQWARDHAASFGGDPRQLVLVGYGSGAYLLSVVAQNMSKDTALRAFYHGMVFGSLLPFNAAMPYRSLAVALRCNDSDLSVSAWLPCFRAAPVDELLQAARASSEWPLQFAPHVDIRTLKTPPASNPPTVVAGVDVADDKALFMERILPLAKPFIRGLFTVESADGIADTLSMISTCASLEVAKAVAEGYHYQVDSTAASGLLQPPLGISELAQFAANG